MVLPKNPSAYLLITKYLDDKFFVKVCEILITIYSFIYNSEKK